VAAWCRDSLMSQHEFFRSLLGLTLSRPDLALAQPANEFVRDTAIQRFEFTFELFGKCLQAYAEESGVEPFRRVTVSGRPFNWA
jgi:hypothetical protein